ncbi:outer membrane efflux protein [Deinococcus phoenicis]|uniref:Outer membrane efflux protein n=1 Tax=Deinococcus phoenicis TaxID=1476583 RepID=A0A016QKL1_9DEIO|nr:TolC family protein [Deinococcus phoenicis]EYB66563.1 outer membrane efflux protein [Deinococcus phoenicis]
MRSPPPAFLLLSLALLGSPAAAAQGTPPAPAPAAAAPAAAAPAAPAPLTLAQTLTRLRASPGWRSADLQYRSAQLALESARARAGLNVTVGADVSAVNFPLASGNTTLGTTVTAQASASVLPWSPAREAVRSAERALDRAAADLQAARLSASVNAVQAYYGARNAAASLALAGAQLALAERQLAAAQAQREAGVLTAEGLLARQDALREAQAAQRQARANVDLAARGLANLLGQSVTLPEGAAAFGSLPAAPQTPGPLDPLIARALTARPEVARAQNDLADARAQQQAAQLDARLPDLTASVQYGELATTGTQSQAGRVIGGSLNVKTGVLAGQVSVPLRDPGERPSGVALTLSGNFPVVGGGKRTALASAGVGVDLAQVALETARQSVDLEVRQRYADLQSALDTLESQRDALTRAQAALTTARARLAAGLATELDVQSAELNAAQAQLGLENASVQATLASLRLSQANGELDPTLLTPAPLTPAPLTPTPAPEARP